MKKKNKYDSKLRRIFQIFLCAILILTMIIPIEISHAGSESSNLAVPDCFRGAGSGIATVLLGAAIAIGLDCLLLGCAITATALVGAGATSVGVGAATTLLVLKGGVTAASMGYAKAILSTK